jgi:hypothetical protein
MELKWPVQLQIIAEAVAAEGIDENPDACMHDAGHTKLFSRVLCEQKVGAEREDGVGR